LTALLSGTGDTLRESAAEILRTTDAALESRFTAAVGDLPGAEQGFVLAVVTAEREPISRTLARALAKGARDRFADQIPVEVGQALAAAEADPRPDTLRTTLRRLGEACPVLVVIDEFGKNLENFTDRPDEGDLFALQALAEESASGAGPVLFFTLQHLAFDDYARAHDLVERREWAKVQGRFEDVAFVETSDDVARLIARALDCDGASPKFRKARRAWAEAAMPRLEELGLSAEFSNGVETVESCYPLHPLAVLALPDLCARFGQHGRTLLSFLAGAEPKSLGDYLQTARWSERHLPTVGLEDVYDFFVASAARQVQASSGASRWAEVDARIRDASALPADQQDMLKVVGLLNLVSQGGLLRASAPLVALALGDGCTTNAGATGGLQTLVDRGVLAYRRFADEYRLWQGSDFDLPAAIQVERDRLGGSSIAQMLSDSNGQRHVVAGRHSQQTGMLRYFQVAYVDHLQGLPESETNADGWLVYHVGAAADEPKILDAMRNRQRPIVLLAASNTDELCNLVVEASAVAAVSRWPELDGDWVAKREVAERLSMLGRQIAETELALFDPRRDGVSLKLVRDGKTSKLRPEAASSGSISPTLSQVSRTIYSRSPVVKNEMLARRELSSQGAKARRELMTAMIDHKTEERLGFTGYGPERAMYEAFLREAGVHALALDGQTWEFQAPKRSSKLRPAYEALEAAIVRTSEGARSAAELMAELRHPPFGLTDGPLPVLLLAVLLVHEDDVAIFQDGTYLPELAADAAERLVKTPDRFSIKHFPVDGGRQRVLDVLAAELAPGPGHVGARNAGLLRAVSPLLRSVRRLPEMVRHDETLSEVAARVRDALLSARDPGQLLFTDLPVACGMPEITAATLDKEAQLFVDQLREAMGELENAYRTTLHWVGRSLTARLKLSQETPALRADLQALGRRLGDKILDPKLQAFVQLAANDGLDDDYWLEAMGLALSERPPVTWRSVDRERFESALMAAAATIRRLEALYFESLVEPTEGFVAQRHTITRADGTEEVMLVTADESAVMSARSEAGRIVDAYLQEGTHELNAFILALWAELQDRAVSVPPARLSPIVVGLSEAAQERTEEQA
jgi:hypothetical protein